MWGILLLALKTHALEGSTSFSGQYFSGTGSGDAVEWLGALDTARAQFAPHPQQQDISMLYLPEWNGFVEGPTWGAWWTQNSYGTTLGALPFLPEPHRTFIRNANWMWFKWEGNGTIVGLDDPHPAPDGCLCDAAMPNGAYYKQGDGNVPIHDWALEETLSGVIMQAEQLLIDRDVDAATNVYLPLFNRTLNLIESRREAALNLFYSGDASNLLAPSYGAWLLPNGTRAPAFLTGMSVSYVAALDRVIELELMAAAANSSSSWAELASTHMSRRALALTGLVRLLEPRGKYFVKSLDPNGTMHGVLGQSAHGYIEAVSNHDAVALGVAERVQPGLDESIMASLLGDAVPPNPQTGGPGLRPYSFVTTNAGGLDDMEYDDSSWLWSYGTWVNGGAWATCEARMMLAYFRTARLNYALDSWRALQGFASIFRMDSPLVEWGSEVYQPNDPINIVYDMFGVAAALLRGLWSPVYSSTSLLITPHIPANITTMNSSVPLRFGQFLLFMSSSGNSSEGISCVTVGGIEWINYSRATINIPFRALPFGPNPVNHTVAVYFGGSACPPPLEPQAPTTATLAKFLPPLHKLSQETAIRALRALIPQDAVVWLDATTLSLNEGDRVALWPDISGNGYDATQGNGSIQPVFGNAGGLPAVVFDGNATFLQNAAMPLPNMSTIFAVFRDHGTTNDCCTGVFYSHGGCNGLGTKVDAEGDSPSSVLMIDWSGSADSGCDDLTNRQVVTSVVYNESGAFSFADTCLQSQEGNVGAAGLAFMIGSRNNELQRFFNGTINEIIVYGRALNELDMAAVHSYLMTKWPAGGKPLSCSGPLPNCTLPATLVASSERLTRFVSSMRSVGRFADSLYELAHALLALDSVAAWETRCAGLANGTYTPLGTPSSEKAADESYVSSATGLATGLATVLDGYAGSADPIQAAIFAIWQSTAPPGASVVRLSALRD